MLITRYEILSAIALPLGIGLTLQGGVGPTAPAPHAPYGDVEHPVVDVSFAEEVAPILEASCVRCHGGAPDGEVVIEAGLNLTSYEKVMAGSEFGSVVEPGSPDDSMLLVLVEDGDMPEEGDPLTPEQIAIIRTWIAEGAQNN